MLPGSLFVWTPAPVKAAMVCLIASIGVLHDYHVWRLPLPANARMIPEDRFRHSLASGGFVFAIELGLGFRTSISSAAAYVFAAAALLWSSNPLVPLLLATGWAVGRWLPALSRLVARDRQLNNRRQMTFPFSRLGSGATLVASALWLGELLT
jgi:hypothetical protein